MINEKSTDAMNEEWDNTRTRRPTLSEEELSKDLNFYARILSEHSVKTFFTEYHARTIFLLAEEQAFRHPAGDPQVVTWEEIQDYAVYMARSGEEPSLINFKERMFFLIWRAREQGEGADQLHCLSKQRMREIFVLGFHSGFYRRIRKEGLSNRPG